MRYCNLQELLNGRKRLIGAEIGVWEGENAEGLFETLDIEKLYLVDPYVGYIDQTQGKGLVIRDFEGAKEETKARIGDNPAIFIYEKSEDAVRQVKEKLDFVYVDAAHTFDNILQDIEVWYPKVKKGGILSGHDFNVPDVSRAVIEFCSNRKIKFSTQPNNEHEWWFIK